QGRRRQKKSSMSTPKVSILLPNLNNRPYLEERLLTIAEQTFSDWELIIVDNYSDDGAYEYFQSQAKKDSRIKLSQVPRAGMYANWNNCIRLAKGEYVYIATSDDTMTPDFLQVMVEALDRYPECALAHCKLKIIDEKGDNSPDLDWDRFYCTAYFGDKIDQKHIRFAPHDGLLHCAVGTVYTSITQLLIRRSIFDKIGLFLTDYGSTADFEWDMRASLIADTIHIPRYLATWRVHRDQGTDQDFLESPEHHTQLLEMIDHAFNTAKKLKPGLLKGINLKELKYFYTKKKFRSEFKERPGRFGRFNVILKWLFINPGILLECFRSVKLHKKPFISNLEPMGSGRKILTKYGFENNINIIQNSTQKTSPPDGRAKQGGISEK
ncbi:MAG: glycosyltransferase, partial [Candidatus Aminicenantes bacterium]|nr:glycosyltransferase [Candidatus Aminicenantes bacterium]